MRAQLRSLLRRPGFVVVTTAVLALGIGATVTLFSLVDAVLIEQLPYPDSERLVWLRERHADVPARPISYPTFLDWRSRSEAFDAIAAVRELRMRWTAQVESRVLDVGLVTAGYFDVIGVPPALGRVFDAADDRYGAPAAAIVSHAFWQTELGGAPDVLGRQLVLDDTPHSIVGVAARGLRLPADPDAWVPMGLRAGPGTGWLDRASRQAGFALGRLEPGVTLADARADMARVQAQLAREYPRYVEGHEVEMLSLKESLVGELRLPVLLGFGSVGLLLVLVCVNVANLFLLRALERRRELALRVALGARPRVIWLELLREASWLAGIGAALGLVLALWGTRLLGWAVSDYVLDETAVAVDAAAVAFTFVLALGVAVAASAVPAWRSATASSGQSLGDDAKTTGEPSRSRAHMSFLVLQTSLAVVLLVGAALLVDSMARILASDPGFDRRGVATLRLLLPAEYASASQLSRLYARLARELDALSGVAAAAVYNDLPGLEPRWQSDIVPEVGGEYRANAPGAEINVDWRIVSADYFATMGIPIRRGRTFTAREAEDGAPVMLVDERLAERFWPDDDAVGRHIKYDGPTEIEIVGIAADVRTYGDTAPGRITIYTPYGRFPYLGAVGVALRAQAAEPASLVEPARGVVRSIDPGIAVLDVATLERRLAGHLAPRSLLTWAVVLFAAFAALLATLGVYSVMSYVVGRRTRELGLRIALGARRRDILALVVRRGMLVAATGIAIGLLAAAGASRMLSGMLYEIGAASVPVYAWVAVPALMTAAAACALPAWRAARVDPLAALRAQ